MKVEQITRGRREFVRWGRSHPNGMLVVLGVAMWIGPLIPLSVMVAIPAIMPEWTPEFISIPIMLVIYLASILMIFVLPVFQFAAWIILPFAAWRACRDFRNKKKLRSGQEHQI